MLNSNSLLHVVPLLLGLLVTPKRRLDARHQIVGHLGDDEEKVHVIDSLYRKKVAYSHGCSIECCLDLRHQIARHLCVYTVCCVCARACTSVLRDGVDVRKRM